MANVKIQMVAKSVVHSLCHINIQTTQLFKTCTAKDMKFPCSHLHTKMIQNTGHKVPMMIGLLRWLVHV